MDKSSGHPLISDHYRNQQTELHHKHDLYGAKSMVFAPVVAILINEMNIQTMLDYGCGKGRLAQSLKINHDIKCTQYDPAIAEFSETPSPQELVCCIDVLEHIEPEYLDNVLHHLKALTRRVGFLTIHTGPAKKILSDGRNAHLIQEPIEWWFPIIKQHFTIIKSYLLPDGFVVVVQARSTI